MNIDTIKKLIWDQINLIEHILNIGVTEKIRNSAKEEISKLKIIAISHLPLDEFIIDNRNILIECCSSIYVKLGYDSRSLPTNKLKDVCKEESDRIMKIWKYIEDLEK